LKVLDQVRQLAEEMLEAAGLELVHMEFVSEGKQWFLRLYIDRDGGVTIDDCVKVSRQLGYELDVADTIPHAYSLEVSSPGVDRIVGKAKDFKRFAGERVRMKLKKAVNGRRNLTGMLKGMDDNTGAVQVDVDGELISVELDNIRRANLQMEPEVPDARKQSRKNLK